MTESTCHCTAAGPIDIPYTTCLLSRWYIVSLLQYVSSEVRHCCLSVDFRYNSICQIRDSRWLCLLTLPSISADTVFTCVYSLKSNWNFKLKYLWAINSINKPIKLIVFKDDLLIVSPLQCLCSTSNAAMRNSWASCCS